MPPGSIPFRYGNLLKMPVVTSASIEDKCTMCGVCALRCPSVAITVEKKQNKLTFYPFRCIVCEVCVHACPSDAIDLIFKWRPSSYDKPEEVYKSTRLEHLRETTDAAKDALASKEDK